MGYELNVSAQATVDLLFYPGGNSGVFLWDKWHRKLQKGASLSHT
jgi:hypothetical protein